MQQVDNAPARRAEFRQSVFRGDGVDIGGAPDPLALYVELFPLMRSVKVRDLRDGDGQTMAGTPDAHYDFVHSSHCLEHLRDPEEGLRNWFRILKPGGHLIVTVPDEDLYEQGQFPSTYNADHKWTFTIFKTESWSDKSRNVVDMIATLGAAADVQKVDLLNATYRYGLPRMDQTLTPIAELGIEFVIRKRMPEEVAFGGRRPIPGKVPDNAFHLLTGIRPQGHN